MVFAHHVETVIPAVVVVVVALGQPRWFEADFAHRVFLTRLALVVALGQVVVSCGSEVVATVRPIGDI